MPRAKVTTKKTTKKAAPKKKAVKKPAIKKPAVKRVLKPKDKFFEAVGRRKTAAARVRLFSTGDKTILVNEKPLEEYFPTKELQHIVKSALEITDVLDKFRITVRVKGGGYHAQAEAVRHGITKALINIDAELRKVLKQAGFVTRDPRMRERKKFGLKRARRAPQWSKR